MKELDKIIKIKDLNDTYQKKLNKLSEDGKEMFMEDLLDFIKNY